MTKLEEAELRLGLIARGTKAAFLPAELAQAIADELDRLRDALKSCERNHELAMISAEHTESHLRAAQAELAALKGEAERIVWVAADDATGAVKSAPWWPTVDLAKMVQGVVGTYVYAVRLSATRVKP